MVDSNLSIQMGHISVSFDPFIVDRMQAFVNVFVSNHMQSEMSYGLVTTEEILHSLEDSDTFQEEVHSNGSCLSINALQVFVSQLQVTIAAESLEVTLRFPNTSDVAVQLPVERFCLTLWQ